MTVAKSSEFIKAEESKNENKNSGSKNKKVATVAAAVVDSGDGKNATTTGAAGSESSSVIKKTKKKKDSNRILVSHTKKPFVFYLNLAKVKLFIFPSYLVILMNIRNWFLCFVGFLHVFCNGFDSFLLLINFACHNDNGLFGCPDN